MARRAPAGLGKSGRALWRATWAEFEMSAPEAALLTEACRTCDRLTAIAEALDGAELVVKGSTGQAKAHPLLAAAALQTTALDTMIRALALPIGDEIVGHRRSGAAREAAQARWRNGAA